ncbi:hypothetical protein SAMN04488003_1022 [Loktanella fryxellensis]|uniref:GguC protein n=1 Tax=Loktanella fryxellensis TaxID=245187 RepID=A0A1H7ZLL7_9RHOB|nr:AraD1 family protein [Loktanella fryxellensis]SEM58347.1 hypothetical protein SAMN04488003_1022 [Loktanella fryxellensis]
MLLSQYRTPAGAIQIAARDGTEAYAVATDQTLYDLAMACATAGISLRDCIGQLGLGAPVDLEALSANGSMLPPLFHPDPAHTCLTGTGLTHLGSAATRAAMHEKADKAETDSMKMFRWGIDGGKPAGDVPGMQPEWFYKGNGHALIAPGAALPSPSFALDGGEEPEIAGVYVIGPDGTPFRVGFALANEFSDHVTEKQNYLYLAHSKLRACAVGPELLIGDLPQDIQGHSRVLRDDVAVFDAPFASGEANMSHSIANLEHHHFKYGIFCQPGDVHIHMFGTATLSFAQGLACRDGDVFEISAPAFGLPLRNTLAVAAPPAAARVTVMTL